MLFSWSPYFRQSSFVVGIFHIVRVRTYKQMRRITARGVITLMADEEPRGYALSHGEIIGNGMCFVAFPMMHQRAISIGNTTSLPLPAALRTRREMLTRLDELPDMHCKRALRPSDGRHGTGPRTKESLAVLRRDMYRGLVTLWANMERDNAVHSHFPLSGDSSERWQGMRRGMRDSQRLMTSLGSLATQV